MKKQLLLFVSLILIIFVMNGCMVGPNFQKTDVKVNNAYRYDSLQLAVEDSVLNISWWELFKDPQLDTLINIGLRENKNVLVAASRIEQSRAQVGYTKADIYPSFGYTVGVQRGNVLAGVPTQGGDPSNIFTGFGTLNWELDFWGKFRRSTEAARAEMLASEYGMRNVQISLISQISGTYFLLLNYQWQLEISINTLDLRQKSLDIIQERYNEGIIAQIDLNQAQIQRAIAASSVPFYERKVAQTENALSILLGRNPNALVLGEKLENQALPPDIPVGIPSMILARRPDILQSQELAHAQTARVGVAQAMRFPAISLTGLLGVASTDLSTLTANGPAWSVGATLVGPLFNFSKNKKRVEIEKYKTEQAVLNYEQTVITAFQEAEDALVEIETLKRELEAREDHVEAAVNARMLSQERYDKGVTSYLELLENERQAFDSELNYSQTTQQLFNGYVKLYKALGGGWLNREEESTATQSSNKE